MSPSNHKERIGFNSGALRHGKMFLHPGLDPQGFFVAKPKACDPALYHPAQSMAHAYERIKKNGVTKDPWQYKKDLEDWCKNLGYKNQFILERRRWFASLLGPAWTIVPEPTKYEPACKNVSFGRTSRTKPSKNFVPGPGTYFRGEPYKAPYGPHSTRPTMEREEPCRFPNRVPNWSLAPDRYNILDKDSIENKSKKIVSLRGPYELFTGKRDGSTIKNHFSNSKKVYSKFWPLKLPGCMEGLKKKHTGEWNKTNRELPPRHRTALDDLAMIPRPASDPAPTTYFEFKEYEFPQYKFGFNSSYDQPPGYVKLRVWPGVGRYNLDKPQPCGGVPGHGHRHVFLSKIGRTIGSYPKEKMNSF